MKRSTPARVAVYQNEKKGAARQLQNCYKMHKREAYEEGVERSKMGFVDYFVQSGADLIPGSHTRTESEQAAFEKGERGERLDEDKEG